MFGCSRRAGLALLLAAALCGACSSSKDDAADTTTSTASLTSAGDGSASTAAPGGPTKSTGPASSTTRSSGTSSPKGAAPSTTAGGGAVNGSAPRGAGDCAVLGGLPAGASETSSYSADLDADGLTDLLSSYAVGAKPGEGDWRLRVSFGAGGGSEVAVADDPAPGVVKVLGTAYLGSDIEPGPGGKRPAIFVWTGSGAAARTVGLYRVDGCELQVMTAPGGGPANFVVGASVGHQEGLRCDGVAGTSLVVEVLSEPNAAGGFDVTRRAYTRSGNALAVYGTAQAAPQANAPDEAAQIVGCGDVRAPA